MSNCIATLQEQNITKIALHSSKIANIWSGWSETSSFQGKILRILNLLLLRLLLFHKWKEEFCKSYLQNRPQMIQKLKHSQALSPYTLETLENNKVFLMFSGGREKERWEKMDWKRWIYNNKTFSFYI